MNEKSREPRGNGAPEEKPGEASQPLTIGDGGVGSKAFEECGAAFVAGRSLTTCGRPIHHPYPHHPFASAQDVDDSPYPEPPECLIDHLEIDDRAFDEAVWRR